MGAGEHFQSPVPRCAVTLMQQACLVSLYTAGEGLTQEVPELGFQMPAQSTLSLFHSVVSLFIN